MTWWMWVCGYVAVAAFMFGVLAAGLEYEKYKGRQETETRVAVGVCAGLWPVTAMFLLGWTVVWMFVRVFK